jgi:hypothetical protein
MKSVDIGKPPLQVPKATPEPMASPAATSEPTALERGEFRTSEVPRGLPCWLAPWPCSTPREVSAPPRPSARTGEGP